MRIGSFSTTRKEKKFFLPLHVFLKKVANFYQNTTNIFTNFDVFIIKYLQYEIVHLINLYQKKNLWFVQAEENF
jgi:hypothetical protein